MYKLILCWRYLRTRYIALASIISVTLGVATMIVVNSVMAGFTTEMQDRIHGVLSDVVFESRSLEGFRDAEWHKDQIRKLVGDSIEGMSATVVVPSMLSFQYGGRWINRQVQVIGIDEATQSDVSDFGKYLQHEKNRSKMSFSLREEGYDTKDHQGGEEAILRRQMEKAGWRHRRAVARARAFEQDLFESDKQKSQPTTKPSKSDVSATSHVTELTEPKAEGKLRPVPKGNTLRLIAPDSPESDVRLADARAVETVKSKTSKKPVDPFAAMEPEEKRFDPAKEQHSGIVVGISLAGYRTSKGEDRFLVVPGDDVKLTLPTAGSPPKAVSDNFTIVDFYESKMSEYDSTFVFVPIRKLQELRGMIDPTTGVGMVSSIQIKLKPGTDGDMVRDRIRMAFSPDLYGVQTWRDKQGPLLAAVQMETSILNVLLFLIIAVAGFGILAIFYMIVVEKTRDIGVLKALGAPGSGVMSIFLSYGLALGAVGSGAGLVLGLLFVKNINQIADLLAKVTGQPVFDPSIYYFYKIPSIVDPVTVGWIVFGAMAIAVLASILPARRAARQHPVEALRYE